MKRSPVPVSPAERIQQMAAFQRPRILLTAVDLGVFDALAAGPRASAAAARTLRADPRAVDRLLCALCSMGLVRKSGGRYANAPDAARFLVRRSPGFLAGLDHSVRLWQSWSTLTDAVRRGRSLPDRGRPDPGASHSFIAAMHWNAASRAKDVARLIGLSGVRRVLDIGGGSGAYSMAFARAIKGLRSVVLDLPDILPITRRYIRAERMQRSVTTTPGDFNRGPFPRGFDLAFLSMIVHINSPAANARLIRRAAAALNPGGRLVIQEFIVDETRTSPPFSAFFALNMLVNTDAGDTYTESEMREWMKAAGLVKITRKDTSAGSGLIIGQKPIA
jgi:SAM-dependent methyltransferase